MNAPRRWLDDPEADHELREVLRDATSARQLDAITRRRLRANVARTAALPAVTASWLFVKSAAAALGVVLGTGALAVSTGVIEWSPAPAVQSRPASKPATPTSDTHQPALVPSAVVTSEGPPADVAEAPAKLNPTPSLPVASPSGSSAGTLSAEALLLEQARREMRTAPSLALAIAKEHAERFPRGQLASERTLIQIEALHRLGRDAEARSLARGLLGGTSAGLYAERIRQLLGDDAQP